MPTIKRALGFSVLATLLSGLIFLSLFTATVILPWHTCSSNETGGDSGESSQDTTTTVDPSYRAETQDGFVPLLEIAGVEENSDSEDGVYYLSLESEEEDSGDSNSRFYDISRTTRILVAASFAMSMFSTVLLVMVARERVSKRLGTGFAVLALVMLFGVSFYYPLMLAQETADQDPSSDLTTEFKAFYFAKETMETEDGSGTVSITRMVGTGWIFFFVAGLFTTSAALNASSHSAYPEQTLSRKEMQERGTLYANPEIIDPLDLGRMAHASLNASFGPPTLALPSQGTPTLLHNPYQQQPPVQMPHLGQQPGHGAQQCLYQQPVPQQAPQGQQTQGNWQQQ